MSTHKATSAEWGALSNERQKMLNEALHGFFRMDATQERLSYIGFEIHIIEEEK